MNDKQLFQLIMAQLRPDLQALAGMSAVQMATKYQPRQQGLPTGPIVYFFKIGDKRYGHPARRDKFDALGGLMAHEEVQRYETTFQFAAWVPQDPADVDGLTESDVLNALSGIIQSDTKIAAFRAAGVGIQRVTEVRNPYFTDDRDRFIAEPTFDVVLTHNRILASTVPTAVTYDANISRI